ncbi:MAG: serine/threonine-protein kinase [Woeseiaceae bacterium]|nr:serine/threonine-protein kinase [Woeseiaceae bacterium]
MNISERAAALFDEAQSRPLEERVDWLREACGDDAELFAEVESLLIAAEQATPFFDKVVASIPALADAIGTLPEESVIGRWRVVARIGQGGMGAVYRVARADEQYEQDAALKILPLGFDSTEARERFLHERQILARLQHENIARLIDGGISDEEVPYFVMDYVDGEPIDSYCDRNRLDIEARVRLFLGVLAAVAHAHSHLVVHRDIKPSNVLVTNEGVVKLLDFGVAKLLSGETGHSQTRVQALTPEFAAPEQMLGGSITTATDVYSLGLLLFTLLAGRNPRESMSSADGTLADRLTVAPKASEFVTDTESLSLEQVEHILESRRTSLTSLRRSLSGDLDNILEKVLAADPEDRYQSAAEFGEDLKRFLDHQPVSAQPPTLGYRVGKYVRRHRGGVATAALMVIILITATVVTTWQSLEAKRQRDEALYQQQRVAATSQFLGILFSDIGSGDEPMTPIDLLDRGVELLENNFGVEERYVASTLLRLSTLYAGLGARQESRELIDRAIDIAREHEDKALLAAMLCERSQHRFFDDEPGAREDISEGLRLLASTSTLSDSARSICYEAQAWMHSRDGDTELAIEDYEAALAIRVASPFRSLGAQAHINNQIGEQYFNLGQPATALRYVEASIEQRDEAGLGDTVPALVVRLNHAAVLKSMGEIHRAAEQQRVVLDRLERVGRPLVGSRNHYGSSLLSLGRYDEALTIFLAELEQARADGNTRWIAANSLNAGRTLVEMERTAEALPYLDEAEALYREAGPRHARWITVIELARADIDVANGDAEAGYERILSLLSDAGYPDETTGAVLSPTLTRAAIVALELNDPVAAEQYASDAYRLSRGRARDERASADVGVVLLLRAKARLAQGRDAGAQADLEIAVPALTNGLGPEHEKTQEARALAGL